MYVSDALEEEVKEEGKRNYFLLFKSKKNCEVVKSQIRYVSQVVTLGICILESKKLDCCKAENKFNKLLLTFLN